MNIAVLRGHIARVYTTQTAFATVLNWDRNKVSKLLKGKYIPTIIEASYISKALNLSKEEYLKIFYH